MFMYRFRIMGFFALIQWQTQVFWELGGVWGGDYATCWCVYILLLCCLNLITSMAQDKASHCGKSIFNRRRYAGSMFPRKQTNKKRKKKDWCKRHTDMEDCIKICESLRLLFDGSAVQSTYSKPAIIWMFLLSLQSWCDVHNTLMKSA